MSFGISFILYLLDAVWLASLIFIPIVWLFDPVEVRWGPAHFTCHWSLKPVLFALFLPVARWILFLLGRDGLKITARGFWTFAWFRRIALACAAIIIFFAAIEGILAAFDFKFTMPAIIFQGKNEFGGIEVDHTVPDTELLYRFKPGDVFEGRVINKLGFRDREVEPAKAEGAVRVICMGDSTTGQGLPGYSQYLHEMLAADPPTPQPWEAINMGVHGYSVRQGLIMFRRYARPLKPDIVTVYYGWNDHWLEAQSDARLMAMRVHPFFGKIFDRLREKRIFMALHYLMNPVSRIRADENNRYLRVPPEEYEALLKQFVTEIKAAGAVPVLITAACRPLTIMLVGQNRIRSRAEGDRLHAQYVNITRKVAEKTGAPLFDLDALFKSPECDRYFALDGIHFDKWGQEGRIGHLLPLEDQPGLHRIAVELHKFLARLVSSPEMQKHFNHDRQPL